LDQPDILPKFSAKDLYSWVTGYSIIPPPSSIDIIVDRQGLYYPKASTCFYSLTLCEERYASSDDMKSDDVMFNHELFYNDLLVAIDSWKANRCAFSMA